MIYALEHYRRPTFRKQTTRKAAINISLVGQRVFAFFTYKACPDS
jgi:hypothetical protein